MNPLHEHQRAELRTYLHKHLPPQYVETWITYPSKIFYGKSAWDLIQEGKFEEVKKKMKRIFESEI